MDLVYLPLEEIASWIVFVGFDEIRGGARSEVDVKSAEFVIVIIKPALTIQVRV